MVRTGRGLELNTLLARLCPAGLVIPRWKIPLFFSLAHTQVNDSPGKRASQTSAKPPPHPEPGALERLASLFPKRQHRPSQQIEDLRAQRESERLERVHDKMRRASQALDVLPDNLKPHPKRNDTRENNTGEGGRPRVLFHVRIRLSPILHTP